MALYQDTILLKLEKGFFEMSYIWASDLLRCRWKRWFGCFLFLCRRRRRLWTKSLEIFNPGRSHFLKIMIIKWRVFNFELKWSNSLKYGNFEIFFRAYYRKETIMKVHGSARSLTSAGFHFGSESLSSSGLCRSSRDRRFLQRSRVQILVVLLSSKNHMQIYHWFFKVQPGLFFIYFCLFV